ncbi:hypothetical protein Patl1_02054 [Pistacia atlantica]|uniref:Uncharacterized protein n=1 Tax=Pistacia atlantica TaxID=434234 RepID=A0ACC1C9L2_9ROSI|nr:hypothetical protein Patl1_02054 [Pistacia atlantica]
MMALRKKSYLWINVLGEWGGLRFYSSKFDLKKLRPMILKRIENRAKDYPVRGMVPVALEVLKARALLIQGISTLMKLVPVQACKRRAKNRVHEWVSGGLNDVLVPVETFHLQRMFQPVIQHNQRFDFDRVPAVVELCWQAGADPNDEDFHTSAGNSDRPIRGVNEVESLSPEDLSLIANGTFKGMGDKVHVGPSGHKARLCGVFKYESWRGTHFWKKAEVDDLVPLKIVWRRRPQDPPVLLNEGTGLLWACTSSGGSMHTGWCNYSS